MRRKAFTLAELLVVVAIIVLLASILVPSVNAAGEMARRANCLMNLRQLGTANHMFSGANKQQMLPGSLDGLAWFQVLSSRGREYIGKAGSETLPVDKWPGSSVLVCPSDRPSKLATRIESAGKGMSYFHNGMLSPDADNPVKFTDLKRPSQTILLSEKDGMAEASAVGANASITTNAAIAGAFATDRHFLGSQHKVGVLMADGHGAEYGRAAVISGTDSGRQIIWWTND